MNKKRILYININNSTFIKKDEDILKEFYDVRVFLFDVRSGNKFYYVFLCIKLFFWMAANIFWCQIIFVRFADYYGLILGMFAKFFKKNLVVVEGGLGAAAYKSIDDGVYLKKFRGYCASYSFKTAKWILPVDESLIYFENNYTVLKEESKQGIIYFNPKIERNKIITVHNGYDEKFWYKLESIPKKMIAVTTANIIRYKVFKNKGINYFIQLAEFFNEYDFYIIGVNENFIESLKINLPQNLKLYEFLSLEEIRKIYSSAKVYIQLSITEGMPNSLCEAMLCECIPVGSNVNAIPNIIGDTGFIVHKQDLEEMKQKIQAAFSSSLNLGENARARISKKFSLEHRRNQLKKIIDYT
ncbi:MAG: glycosyltransferase family 4 protein [Bacteroidota bacterium]|nr:glycosyltransferase family 4 protein [Bacteroidota bacterium]